MSTFAFTTTSPIVRKAARLACGLTLLAALSAQAESLSVLPSVTNVLKGSSFSLDVQATGFADRTNGGGFNLDFDPTVLHLDSIVIPASWEFLRSTGTVSASGGSVTDINFNTFTSPVSGSFLTATLNFTAIEAGSSQVKLSANDFVFGDSLGNPVAVSFNAATVNVAAVPEPGSLSLVITGLAAVGGLMRRRRQPHQG